MLLESRRLLSVLALSVLVVAGSWAADPQDQTGAKLTEDEQKILELTNAARAREQLPPLKANPVLTEVARAHSANMAKQQKMDHVLDGKNPSDRVKAAGYAYSWVGENVAYTNGDTPAKVFDMWMNSPHHRENILRDKYQEIGIGIASNPQGETYYTQVFGTQRRSRP